MGNEIFEKNLKAMEKWYPAFAGMVKKKDEEPGEEDGIEVLAEDSWDGQRIFRVCRDGKKLYLNGKRNALKPLDMWMENMGKLHNHAAVFLFGMGSGLYLQRLLEDVGEHVGIVIYEPSCAIFLEALRQADLSEAIEGHLIAFVVEGINGEEFAPIMRRVLVWENLHFLRNSIHPGYMELFGEELKPNVKKLNSYAVEMRVQANTGLSMSAHLAQNILGNLKYIREGYHTKCLFSCMPHDVPAVLVSAGPSLNRSLESLKEAKGRAFVLAVDTAMKPLLKAGVVPDVFATIDAKKDMCLFETEGIGKVPIVAPTCARTSIMEKQERRIFFDDGYLLPRHLYAINGKEFPRVDMGGSVACMAFSLLYKMGFETVILVGQDLAYTDNKSHADGTFQETMPKEDVRGMKTVKGNYVDKIPSRTDFLMFLDWFVDYIGMAKRLDPAFRVINATDGGAYIEGTELMRLPEAIQETCGRQVDFEACIRKISPAFTEEEQRKIDEYIRSIPGEFISVASLAGRLKKTYLKLEAFSRSGDMDAGRAGKILRRIKKLTRKIHEKEVYQLIDVSTPVADYTIRGEMFCEKDSPEEELREVARKGILYCDIVAECAKALGEFAEAEAGDMKAERTQA